MQIEGLLHLCNYSMITERLFNPDNIYYWPEIMRLREKTLIVIVAIFAVLILIEFAFSDRIIMDSFYGLERNDTLQKVYQADGAFRKELQSIDALLVDRATRDDAYAYMEFPSPRYLDQNMKDEALVSLGLDLLLLVDGSGQIAYGKAMDLGSRTAVPLPESVRPHVFNDSPLVLRSEHDSMSGVLDLPEGPMLVVSRPILNGTGQGPARGTMIMGRYVDDGLVRTLSETTRLNLSMHRFDEQGLPADLQAVQNRSADEFPFITMPLDEDRIGGYEVIDDVYGKPALILRVETPRPIYQNGKDTIAYIILSTLAVGIVVAAMAILLLEQIVLSRLSRLDAAVIRISASNDLSARVSVVGSDEVSNLSRAVNSMLASLDLSSQKLHESESRYHAIVEDQSELICRFRPDGSILFANEAYRRYFGPDDRAPGPGQNFLELLPPVTRQGVDDLLRSLSVSEPAGILECRFGANGEAPWLQWNVRAIFDRQGNITEFQAVGRDITGRMEAEERIKASLREKEALLKEIHHRVKNNLQIISSILSLQEARVTDAASREMLRDSRNRIRSMALIHEKLYGSYDLSRINFTEYIASLLGNIRATYGTGKGRVGIRTDVGDVSLNIDTAIPLGLIINELVTNSYKHAFPGDAQGEIFVELRPAGAGQYTLTVGDTGVGFPPDVDVHNTSSLGLQLVKALASQTRSHLTVERKGGTVFTIVFPAGGGEAKTAA